mmetsp:Transcript_13105/g.24510  ORF Transcript_13105/g.24510 Transcript_13105/m.24510 type:complete len:187 (+) Transcript_13105:2180-2740(+)
MSYSYVKCDPTKSCARSSHSLPRRQTRFSLRRPSKQMKLNKSIRSKTPSVLPPLRLSLECERNTEILVLPPLPRPQSPIFHKFELPVTPKRLPPVLQIKRRFRNIARIVREVPQEDFNTAIAVDAPLAENLLHRNWEKKTAALREVIPVYENTFEEDDWTDKDEPDTPLVLKFLADRQRLKEGLAS